MIRDRARDAVFLLPGIAWLVVFFAVPLGIIFVVSLGTRDQFGGVVLNSLGFQNYTRALEPDFLPTVANSLRYAALTTIFSIAIAYPIAYWISRPIRHAPAPLSTRFPRAFRLRCTRYSCTSLSAMCGRTVGLAWFAALIMAAEPFSRLGVMPRRPPGRNLNRAR